MFDTIKRWFGEGHIYCDFECDDGFLGRSKAPYIGDPATFNREEYVQHIHNEVRHHYGRRVTKVTNIRIS